MRVSRDVVRPQVPDWAHGNPRSLQTYHQVSHSTPPQGIPKCESYVFRMLQREAAEDTHVEEPRPRPQMPVFS